MALRLVEIYMPAGLEGLVDDLNDSFTLLSQVSLDVGDGRKIMRVLIDTAETEAFLDELERRIGSAVEFRVVLIPVEATLPRPVPTIDPALPKPKKWFIAHIGREELYQDVEGAIRSRTVFFMMVVLSTIVAAIGLLQNNVAVVIGAMVIAPLLGPNMALALGVALGDPALLRRAVQVNVAGVSVALGMAILIGMVFINPELYPAAYSEVAARTRVGMGDVILALAAGVAGTLSITMGVGSTLVGVMVAVALLPPLVTVGLMLGIGAWDHAYRAFLLLGTNIVSVNFAAVATFVIQGIRPTTYFDQERARRGSRIAIGLSLLVLALLIGAILLANGALG